MKTNYKKLFLMLLLTSSIAFSQQNVFIDIGGAGETTASNYNNITSVGDMNPLSLINEAGASTTFSITLTDGFIDVNNNGAGNGTNASATGDAAIFEDQATRDSFFGSSNHGGIDDQLGSFDFTGLDDSKFYSFTIYAARIPGSSDRVAQYEFIGASTLSVTLNASDNSSNVALANNIQPTAGKITLNVTPHSSNTHSSKYFYFGALKMTETDAVLAIREAILEENGLNIYPNPVGDELNIDYILNTDSISSILVYDISGRVVYNVKNAKNKAGVYSYKWNRADNSGVKLASGTYFLKLQTEKGTFSKKLILK